MNDINEYSCLSCKFFLYIKEKENYECTIKGCYNYSKFKEFDLVEWIREGRERKSI